ncbi:MAG: hypothetical protein A3K10_04490 [Bacteroidetes bacterium RIFCSPLOWO2_12_FULL_31_6]|nr:MAG: hypothetical protein A3K10_04490 [Bacteroidetes bacterium RIFCSPLOWO2_12_FULL_31_6]
MNVKAKILEYYGYIAALIVGLTLGLIGAGGSILTVPVFVYLFGIDATDTAPAYSLFVVGFSSLIGVIIKSRQKEVNFKMALFFGIPTVIAIFFTRKYLVPAIPDQLFHIGTFVITKRLLIMGVFAIVMIVVALVMIKGSHIVNDIKLNQKNYILNFIAGLGIGSLTGLVGAGGGFIIIPAIIKIGKLSMKIAIGTSLAIVTMNSFVGFIGSLGEIVVDWNFLLPYTFIAGVGICIGIFLAQKIEGAQLKKGFAYFILSMGILILIKEIIIQ